MATQPTSASNSASTPTSVPTSPSASPRATAVTRGHRLTGVLALAAALSTILLAGLAITALATAELRVRSAVATQQALDGAVAEAAACASLFASRTGAWKSYLLAEIRSDEDTATRSKDVLATTSGDLNDRLAALAEFGRRAELPTEGAERAAQSATQATLLLVEAIADTRGANDEAHAAADQRTMSAIDQVQYELSAVHADWSRRATEIRLEETAKASDSARRMKAWIEILSLLAVTLVFIIGAVAVRKDASRGGV